MAQDDRQQQAPAPIEVDVDALRKLEDASEPAVAKQRTSPMANPGAPGGTSGTGGTTHDQDD